MNTQSRREENHTMASPRSVVVTYYEGDINTVVDEHFFRALSRNNTPKDLSVKHRERPTPRHTDCLTPPSWTTSWSRSVCSPNHTSHAAPGFSAEEAVRSSSVIVSRPETSTSWSLPQNYVLTPLAPRTICSSIVPLSGMRCVDGREHTGFLHHAPIILSFV